MKTQTALSEKIISSRTFSFFFILRNQGIKISKSQKSMKNNVRKSIRLSNGPLCYGYKPAVSWLNWRAEHGKGKWKYSKDIFKNCKRTGISLVANNILPFSLTFHKAERLLYFNILGNFQ